MDATRNKVSVLLQPLLIGMAFPQSPSSTEIDAAASVIHTFTSLLYELHDDTLEHWPSQFATSEWLSIEAWDNFMIQMEQTCSRVKQQTVIAEALAHLHQLIDDVRSRVSRTPQGQRKSRSKFLDTPVRRQKYMPVVYKYQSSFIDDFDPPLSHKQRIPLYAMLYEAIRVDANYDRCFDGAGFDRLVYDACRIDYNGADNPKGRYRAVGEVWKRLFMQTSRGYQEYEYGQLVVMIREQKKLSERNVQSAMSHADRMNYLVEQRKRTGDDSGL